MKIFDINDEAAVVDWLENYVSTLVQNQDLKDKLVELNNIYDNDQLNISVIKDNIAEKFYITIQITDFIPKQRFYFPDDEKVIIYEYLSIFFHYLLGKPSNLIEEFFLDFLSESLESYVLDLLKETK